MKRPVISRFFPWVKRLTGRKPAAEPIQQHPRKIIDVVELGPGHKTDGLRSLITVPGMEVHGIDRVVKNQRISSNGGVALLKRGRFLPVLRRDYAAESVKKFKMSIVLSYQGKPAVMAKRYRRVFQAVFEKLVLGGEFVVSEPREHIEAIKPVLETAGFEVKEFRKAKKEELSGFWQKIYAKGKEKQPWIIRAVKPEK